jgi:hypothetical protein
MFLAGLVVQHMAIFDLIPYVGQRQVRLRLGEQFVDQFQIAERNSSITVTNIGDPLQPLCVEVKPKRVKL